MLNPIYYTGPGYDVELIGPWLFINGGVQDVEGWTREQIEAAVNAAVPGGVK